MDISSNLTRDNLNMAKKGYFKREIESLLIVAQRNAIRSTSK